VSLPDPLLERQYYLDTYKLGCVARSHTPAITLQAVWTADNGSLPPWKGDFHHDLNTQLSYWPTYSGNRLALAASFTHWMWGIRKEARAYTQHYFGKPGLNVPGVTTISGKPMGGWIQYSMSPAISAWLAQHFYWEWKYGMDPAFLRKRAWPWVRECARFLEHLTYISPSGKRRLPLSSSPEYHDNRIEAWFEGFTNHDLALAHFAFQAAAELASTLGQDKEAAHWQALRSELPALDQSQNGLTIAPGQELDESHRHHAHLIGIYPLTILNPDIPTDSALIRRSLAHLQQQGTRSWTGYSFAWAASLFAQARDAENAAQNLQIFASNFVSTNSFHLNGDQKGGQYSNFTYRPFTLEGNFAFAQGVHEMLLQSNKGYIEVFPAVPDTWTTLSFRNLRTEGGFLVSAEKVAGKLARVEIFSEKGGTALVALPGTTLRQQVTLRPGERKTLRLD
jgi:alpha-L-fucosidase 2